MIHTLQLTGVMCSGSRLVSSRNAERPDTNLLNCRAAMTHCWELGACLAAVALLRCWPVGRGCTEQERAESTKGRVRTKGEMRNVCRVRAGQIRSCVPVDPGIKNSRRMNDDAPNSNR